MTNGIAATGKRVLIVEDDNQLRTILAESLRRRGYAVSVAIDGADGVRQVREAPCERFDVVVMDYSMPGLTGGEAANLMRAVCPDLPILYLSGRSLPGDLRSAEVVIQKPVSPEQLVDAIERLLRSTEETDPHGFEPPSEPSKDGG